MLHEFKLGRNATKATKSICCAKDEGVIDHSILTKWFKKFCSGYKNLNKQERSGRPKTMDFKAVLQAIETDPVQHLESIRRAQHLTVQCGSSPSRPQQKHTELLNGASY